MNWYVVHTYSGFEKRVKRDIEHRVSIEGLRSSLGQVVIPEVKTREVGDKKRSASTKNIMPGYVFVQMDPDEELFKTIREINGVSNFVGTEGMPSPLSDDEIGNILDKIEEKEEAPKLEIKFNKGDQVKVTEGPFSNFIGTVQDIDHERARLKVMVSIFGRQTPVDLGVMEVEQT